MSMKRLDIPFRSTIQNAGAVAVDEVDHPSPLLVFHNRPSRFSKQLIGMVGDKAMQFRTLSQCMINQFGVHFCFPLFVEVTVVASQRTTVYRLSGHCELGSAVEFDRFAGSPILTDVDLDGTDTIGRVAAAAHAVNPSPFAAGQPDLRFGLARVATSHLLDLGERFGNRLADAPIVGDHDQNVTGGLLFHFASPLG